MISKCCSKKLFKDFVGNKRCSECLLIAKPKRTLKLAYIALFSLLFLSFTIPNIKYSFSSPIKYTIIEDSCKDVELNDDSILHELERDSCDFPLVALKQYHKETNFGKSNLVKENNNLFGLKCSCYLCKGFKNGHSYNSSRTDCILCYTHFMNSYWKKYCNVYASDPNYLVDLNKTN